MLFLSTLAILAATNAYVVRAAVLPISSTADLQLDQSTSLPYEIDNAGKCLLGGELAYIVAQTTCVPGDVKDRSCGVNCDATPGYTVLYQGGDAASIPYWAVGFSESLDAIVVSFSGTNFSSVLSPINDAELALVPIDSMYSSLANYTTGTPLVHYGFQATSLRALVKVIPDTLSALKTYPDVKRVLVSGHSLGASMSVFSALALYLNVPSGIHVQLLNYALPRNGNAAWADIINAVLPDSQTVTFRNDPVPHVLVPGPVYRHSIGERWVQSVNGNNTLENSYTLHCDGEENENCSDSIPSTDYIIQDHTGPYFGVQFGQSPCKDFNTTSNEYGL